MKINKYYILSLLLLLALQYAKAQPFSVNVTTTAVPPVNPVISQYVVSGSLSASLMYGAVGTPPIQVYVQGRIECLSPSPFTIAVNPAYSQAGTVTLTPGAPTQLIATQLSGAFGFFNDNNLVTTGITLASLKDANNNIKLPAGVYRICFLTRQVNPASGLPGNNLSDPNLGCGNFNIQNAQPSNSVLINTMVIPPAGSAIAAFIFKGGVKPTVQYNNAGGGNMQVKLFGKIERLSPSPFTISLNANYAQQQPVTLIPGVPIQLSPNQVADAFGNFSDNNLTVSGIPFPQLKDANNNIVLPDGTYRVCFYARTIDPASGALGSNASDPNLGCGTFGICATAAAPQFTQPVSNLNIKSSMVVVQKVSPIVFAWTPPSNTCGGQLGALSYDFEIHELFNGQTVTDAIHNPPLFTKTQLPSSTFLFDTLLNNGILQSGKQYVIRVRANAATNAMVQKIDNNGYSRIEAFQYGETGKTPDPPANPPPDNNNQPPQVNGVEGDCKIPVPSNTTLIGSNEILKGKEIKIGEFTLIPSAITRNNDNTYTGKGTINWNPVIGKANLIVAFDKIKINTDKAVFDGTIVTQTDPGVFKSEKFDEFKDFAKKTGAGLDKLAGDVEGFINKNPGARLLSKLDGSTPVDLPIGLNNQDIGGVPVTLEIVSIIFSPKGATMSLLFDMNIPEASGWLTLAGTGFCIHPSSISLNTGTLFLPTDRDFNIGGGQNNMNIKFKGCPSADSTKGTYVSWQNGKLSDIVAHAEISFPQSLMVPEDNDGKVAAGSVVAKLLFRFKKWEDWMAAIDLPNFQLTDVKGLSFHPGSIYYDHSVLSNAEGFTYPANIKKQKGNDFEGLYIKEFKILLPEDFKTFNQKKGERTDFTATNLIIDDEGLSVFVKGTDVIDIKTGNMGGWGFSLHNIEVDIQGSTFTSGKMDGKILLPVSSTPLDYSGDLHIDKGNDTLKYAFVIKPSAKMSWDIWKASVELKPSSYVQVKRDASGAAVTALLNGDVSIILSSGTPALKFEAITFDSLGISNRNIITNKKEFWMSPGVWGMIGLPKKKPSSVYHLSRSEEVLAGPYSGIFSEEDEDADDNSSSQGSVAGFPINLDHILPYVELGTTVKAGLKLNIFMGIGGADKSILSASTAIKIYGEAEFGINTEDYRPKFKISGGIDVDSIKLEGQAGPVAIKGYLAFYNKDKTFGDGIKGHVEATFPMVKIEATAQFGNVNDYNYWYIDACAQFSQPIPIIGFLGINGFGGGAYYNMALQNDPPQSDTMSAKNVANNSKPGTSMSGISFVPSEGVFGLRATVLICMTSGAGPKAMNAKITMGAQIANGAFQKLTLSGDAYVFTNPPSNDKAIVKGHVEIIYNIPEKEFSLNAELIANFSVAKLTVPLSIYTAPKGWYFKVGDPWAKKVTLDFPESKTAFYHYKVGASAYFVAGSLINPQFPDLPVEVTSMLHITTEPKIQAFIDELNKTPGSGMMFGAEVHGSLGFNVAIIYADADAVLGFDMMLKNFTGLTCNGGKSAGWEDWYALGQLYAYLKLDVGLAIDVWFYSGKVSLAKFAAGAYLRGGLPNPTWMDGAVAIEGAVLGGLIKVNTQAHFSIGDKCYPDPDPLRDIKIISDYGPRGNKESVFSYPYAASNVGLEKNYEITLPPTNDNTDGEVRVYQFKIKSFRLLKDGTTAVPDAGLEYSNDQSTVSLKRNIILDGNANYQAEIDCYAMQYYGGAKGIQGWGLPWNDKLGKPVAVEEATPFSFTTGPQPDSIPDGNIAFSYPVDKQRYVLIKELNGKGKIHLDQDQDNILIGDGTGLNAMRSYKLYFIPVGSTDTVKTNFTWNDNSRDIEYALPAGLKNNTPYKLEFWSFEKSSMTMAFNGASTLKTETKMSATNVKGVEKKETRVVSAALKIPKPIYTMVYRTSAFNTLSDKLNAMGGWGSVQKSNALYITNDEMSTEHFDDFETKGFTAPNGVNYYPPLLNIDIAWDHKQENDRWAEDELYTNAFFLSSKSVTTDFGVSWLRDGSLIPVPVKNIDLSRLYSDKPLSPAEAGQPVAAPKNSKIISSGYSVSLPVNKSSSNQSGGSVFGYQTIGWDRERYLLADYKLMNDFAYSVVFNAGAFSNWSAAYTENYLKKMSGNIDFASNSLGGIVTMPWKKFYYLYTDQKYMGIINHLKTLLFTAYPKGNRTMQWMYKAGNMQGNKISKTFGY